MTVVGNTPDLEITDLAAPRIAPEVAVMMQAAVEVSPPLGVDVDELVAAAVERSGLQRFGRGDAAVASACELIGDGAVLDRLALLLRALRSIELSAFGHVSMRAMLVQMLSNRLLLEDLFDRQPEIGDVAIDEPIIIAGLQRSGTTHLHNLLAADPQLRHLPYWESLEPVPPAGERHAPGEPDPRVARCEMALDFQDRLMPHFKAMHEMTATHAHEEIQLMAADFSSMLFEAIVPLPVWRDAYVARDQTATYRFMRRVLQALTWLRGGKRWVLKSPQHLEQLPVLAQVFPDATFVLTHRDPAAVIGSIATMNAYAARVHKDRVDLESLGRYWVDRTEAMLQRCVADRGCLDPERSLDVPFREFVADEMAVVEKIWALSSRTPVEPSREALRRYQEAHKRYRHGKVHYRLQDFGLSAPELRERFQFYCDRFSV